MGNNNELDGTVSPVQYYLMYIAIFLSFPLLLFFTDSHHLKAIEQGVYLLIGALLLVSLSNRFFKKRIFETISLVLTGFITSFVLMIIFYSLDK